MYIIRNTLTTLYFPQVVKLLLANGANVEHRTKEGFTPLMFAALGGHVDVAK